tara:strand:- start:892 stop:1914 length:1023 start_codon:yes stop_codon:yes gene_type:complete
MNGIPTDNLDINKQDISTNSNFFKNIIQNTKDNIQDTFNKGSEGVTDNIKSMSNNPVTIIGLLVVIIFAIILSYIMYYFISSNLFNQSRVIISGTKMPVLCNILKKHNITKKNPSGNGKKRTYTFWIYVNDLNYMTNSYKNVAYIGDENSLKNRSPYIFLDKNNNKLFVRFSKQDISSGGDDSLSNNFENAKSANDIDNMGDFYNFISQGITIDYVPIQRWVHIAIVINDIGRSATMSAYVDGDISKMITNGNEISESQGHIYNITNLDLDKDNILYTGGNKTDYNQPGFSGLISKFSMYNYDLNDRDIYNDYNEGPIDNLLAKLGLGAYGIRSPVYKIT